MDDPRILDNLPLVRLIVRDFMARLPAHVGPDDLIGAGNLGLVLAARDFDPSHGVPFGRYARQRIYGAIGDELRRMDWASRSVRTKAREVETARELLTAALSRTPTRDELADCLDIGLDDLADIEADVHSAAVLSLDAFAWQPDELDAALLDLLASPEETVIGRELGAYLRSMFDVLPERVRFAVEESFTKRRLMAAIAVDLGVTESRISQLRAAGVRLLRQHLIDVGHLAAA